MKGRKPKPTAFKVLAGNPGCRPLPVEPDLPAANYAIPKEIKGKGFADARKEWKRVAPLLSDAGVMKETDRTALLLYVQALQRYVIAEKEFRRIGMFQITGEGYLTVHPTHAIMRAALEQMIKFMSEFGLTPTTRARIKPDKAPEETKLDSLIKQSGKR